MFKKSSINSCKRYMYLDTYKSNLKEPFKLPSVIDYKIAKNNLINLIGENNATLEYSYLDFHTKIDYLSNGNYYMFNFSKLSLNENKLKKICYDKFILEKNNVKIDKYFYVNIDSKFIKNGEIDYTKFFKFNEVVEFPYDLLDVFEALKEEIKEPLNNHCKKCPYIKYCISEYVDFNKSIFSLRGKIDDLLDTINYDIKNVDLNKLSLDQLRQIKNEEYINIEEIEKFFSNIKYPINFIDFERANLIIPFFDGDKPNQGFPFQYSLHILDKNLKHYDFVIDDLSNLRDLAKNLNDVLGSGSIMCYGISMEKSLFKMLSDIFPEYENLKIEDSRYIDLSLVFQNGYYYNPLMNGDYSIKSVLPALTNSSYKLLDDIDSGIDAADSFVRLKYEENKEELIKKMKDYCKLDTYAMYLIFNELNKKIKR